MFETRSVRSLAVLAAAALGFLPGLAEGSMADLALQIEASSELGSGSLDITLGMSDFDAGTGAYQWQGENIAFGGGVAGDGGIIAMFSSLLVIIGQDDPQVTILFSLEAGGADTQVTISSGLVEFPEITSAEGVASVGMTLTDGNGDGASLGVETAAYTAQYNGLVPGGETFLAAIDGLTADPGTSTDASVTFPAGGFEPIGATVSSISSQFSFLLSAGDQASGTSNFLVRAAPAVVPLPAPLGMGLAGLAGLAGIAGIRRRRG